MEKKSQITFEFQGKTLISIDCSLHSISVCVSAKDQIKAEITINQCQHASKVLLQLIERTLQDAQITKQKLDAICITNGPGSFTALRISLATVTALSLSLNIPVFSIDNLQIIAQQFILSKKPIVILQKAYQDYYFCGIYHVMMSEIKKKDLFAIKKNEIPNIITSHDLIIASDDSLYTDLNIIKDKPNRFLSHPYNIPTAKNIIQYFSQLKTIQIDETPLEPIYLLQAEAEKNYKRK